MNLLVRETSGNYNIEIGKYVLPRTMITYTQGINNKQNKYGIEYSLRRNVKFNAWIHHKVVPILVDVGHEEF